jgi:hypothetical protein
MVTALPRHTFGETGWLAMLAAGRIETDTILLTTMQVYCPETGPLFLTPVASL